MVNQNNTDPKMVEKMNDVHLAFYLQFLLTFHKNLSHLLRLFDLIHFLHQIYMMKMGQEDSEEYQHTDIEKQLFV
jgi:hypothetical protein